MSASPETTGRNLLDRLARLTAATDAAGHPIHNLHPYPAKYIPALPRDVIAEQVNERHLVLDPFCGSGTSLVEAALAPVRSVGIDSNPIAALASRAKTTPLTRSDLAQAHSLLERLSAPTAIRSAKRAKAPRIARLDHWFQHNMQQELAYLLSEIRQEGGAVEQFMTCVFSSVITSVSNQDSETRYTAIDKQLPDGYAIERFTRKLAKSLPAIEQFSKNLRSARYVPRVINKSIVALSDREIPDASIDLIVTSPPYPNSFDYYLYHKLRMLWLGYNVQHVQEQEIGSRYEHSSRKAPIECFIEKMKPVMRQLRRVLKPSKLAYLFVGDSVLSGQLIDMAELYARLADEAGFKVVEEKAYDLGLVSRSFRDTRGAAGAAHKYVKMQRIIVLEGGKRSKNNSNTRAAALSATRAQPQTLKGLPAQRSVIALASDEGDRHVHGVIPYPSKFIPEIPRWAIELFSSPGDAVLDPFAGSGTTAVEALVAGRHAASVDVSPWAALVAQAKTTYCDNVHLNRAVEKLKRAISNPSNLPSAPRKSFELDDFWFDTNHLNEFARIRAFIANELPTELSAFFDVALGSTIRNFSYQDLGQIKVKRDPKKVASGTPSPSVVLTKRIDGFAKRLARFNELALARPSHSVFAMSMDEWGQAQAGAEYDLLVTSPPYINAMNYAMSSRYELLLLGLIEPEELNAHQQKYFGTERVYSRSYRDFPEFDSSWSDAEELNALMGRVRASEPKRAYIAYLFFTQAKRAFASVLPLLRPGARVVLVTGTNRIRGVHIDTHRFVWRMVQDLGATFDTEFYYEIIKQRLKITRHETAALIPNDGVAVLTWPGVNR